MLLVLSSNNTKGAITLDFYGENITIKTKPVEVLQNLNLSEIDLTNLYNDEFIKDIIDELDEYSYKYQLDDISYLQLAKKTANAFYLNKIYQKLLLYNLLKKKGYDVIIGYNHNDISIYGYSCINFYNINLVQYNNKTYYDLYFEKNKPLVKEKLLHEESSKSRCFVLNTNYPPKLNKLKAKYRLHMEYEGIAYFFNGYYNKSLALYYKDLPDIEFGEVYINYGLSETSSETLIKQLKKAVYGMSNNKALDFLLSFTQQAFPYKSDLDYIGNEKFSFPEELFLNPFADCEDKSFMLAVLAKEILGLKSLAVLYLSQNHLNVAINTNTKGNNYNFMYLNQKYLICETTRIGLKPGENFFDLKKAYLLEW